MAAGTPVIVTRQLTKTYAGAGVAVAALRGISLTVERGEYLAVMGASGSGKSTLAHILGCLDLPTGGRYLLDGVDVRGLGEDQLARIRNRKIGFVFQSFNLLAHATAIENVELPLIYQGVARAERRHRALAALRSVGGERWRDHRPNQLSGGTIQKVALARAIVTDPALLLADEPTGNLDSASSDDVLASFARLNAAGRTIVMITHEADVAARARRLVRIRDGRVVEDRPISSERPVAAAVAAAPPAGARDQPQPLGQPA